MQSSWNKNAIKVLIAGAAIEAFFAQIFESLKPGGNAVWQWMLGGLGAIFTSLTDFPYRLAASNPSAIPSILLMEIVPIVPPVLIVLLIAKQRSAEKARIKTEEWMKRNSSDEERKRDLDLLKKRTNRYTWVSVLLAALLFFQLELSAAIITHAIDAKVIFDVDRDIVAPFLGKDQLAEIQSDSVSVATKADYRAIMQKIGLVAAGHHLRLRVESDEFDPKENTNSKPFASRAPE